MPKNRNTSLVKIHCPKCNGSVSLPLLWIIGVESIFRCRSCGTKFCTGYKAGAVLFALAFVLAVATVNLLCLAVGSRSMMILFYAGLPLWILYGLFLRRAWLLRRTRRQLKA